MINDIEAHVREKLRERFLRGGPSLPVTRSGYVEDLQTNLLPGVTLDLFEPDYHGAKGQETASVNGAPAKMQALHSSATLVVNSFAPWKHSPAQLTLAGEQGLTVEKFEKVLPTGLAGTPPHLDLFCAGPASIVAVESKFTEYLTPKAALFSPRYDGVTDERRESPWFQQIKPLRKNSATYRHLDGAQLVKHWLGLSLHMRRIGERRRALLLYVFWEPSNPGADRAFQLHRDEIAAFSTAVAGDPIAFHAVSYPEIWASWAQSPDPTWLAEHARRLNERYVVEL